MLDAWRKTLKAETGSWDPLKETPCQATVTSILHLLEGGFFFQINLKPTRAVPTQERIEERRSLLKDERKSVSGVFFFF